MIPYAEALEIIQKHGRQSPLASESVGIEDIAGRICAENIAAPMANQPFDNSSRDGFALRAEDIEAAANDNPVTLPLAGTVYAGDAPVSAASAAGKCYGIMTGAPLPAGCNAVVPLEQVSELVEVGKPGIRTIIFKARVQTGDFVRRAGEDFKTGDTVLRRNMRLRVLHTLSLATLGISQVSVLKKPKVSIICTGGEVVEDLSATLKDGLIYNASGPYLRSALGTFGMEFCTYAAVGDDAALYKKKLQEAADAGADIILSTGAVAVGAHDFVPAVLKELQADILFHQVGVRPGRPGLFAKLKNGPFFFGLPGNPVSTSVGLRFFVVPLLRAMQGLSPETPRRVTIKTPYNKGKSGLYFFMRAATDGTTAEIPQNQQSFMVSPMLHTNAWAVIPEATETLAAGDTVDIYTNDGDEWLQAQ